MRPCPGALCSCEATQRGFPCWPRHRLQHETAQKASWVGPQNALSLHSPWIPSSPRRCAGLCRAPLCPLSRVAAAWLCRPRSSPQTFVLHVSRLVLRGLSSPRHAASGHTPCDPHHSGPQAVRVKPKTPLREGGARPSRIERATRGSIATTKVDVCPEGRHGAGGATRGRAAKVCLKSRLSSALEAGGA